MTEGKARTALGQASEAVTLARDLQDRIRSLESANFDLRRQNRDLKQRLAAAEMCVGKRGTIGDDDE